MTGAIALVGGDEFRPGCEEMDRFILAAMGEYPASVLVLPTADVTAPQKAASNGVGYFSSLGAMASGLMVLDREHADDENFIKPISETSLVYFTGGSPEHLLATLWGSRLLDSILQHLASGKVIGGSSAGAMVMGSMIRHPSSGEWAHGLEIAHGLAVLPHHENRDPEAVARDLANTAPPGLKVLGIDARTCCFGAPGSWRVLGFGKVTAYEDSSWTTFNAGEKIPEGF